MFSSFTKFLPTNVNITTPDFLKPANHSANHSPEATSTSTDAKQRNVLTKSKAGMGIQPDSQISTMDTVSVNDSENAHNVENSTSRIKNESKSRKRKDAATATEVSDSVIALQLNLDQLQRCLELVRVLMGPCP